MATNTKNFRTAKVYKMKGPGYYYSVTNSMGIEIGRIGEWDVFYLDTGNMNVEWSLSIHNTLHPFTPSDLSELHEIVHDIRYNETCGKEKATCQ